MKPRAVSPDFCGAVPTDAAAEALADKFSCAAAGFPNLTVFSELVAVSFCLSLLDKRGLSLVFCTDVERIPRAGVPPEDEIAVVDRAEGAALVVEAVDLGRDPIENVVRGLEAVVVVTAAPVNKAFVFGAETVESPPEKQKETKIRFVKT